MYCPSQYYIIYKQIFLFSQQIVNTYFYGSFRNRKSANLWGVKIRKSQIRKLVMINPQFANPQISLVSQSANRKSANLQGKSSISDPHWFASNTFLLPT